MPRRRPIAVLLTCEHAGNRVPAEYRSLFREHGALLRSHRGWDPGALSLARSLARSLDAPLLFTATTRLLIEANRSPGHPSLFSPITRGLPAVEKRRILEKYYLGHRNAVAARVGELMAAGGGVVHVGVHTFTPVLNGARRNADVGLLYDPARPHERVFCDHWARELRAAGPALRIRRNYPYRGASDGLTTALRREFRSKSYLGIELEVNQAIATDAAAARRVGRAVAAALRAAVVTCPWPAPARPASSRPR